MLKGNLPEVFLDTDVAFDIISRREPFFKEAIQILELAAIEQINLVIAESSLANLIYLAFDIYKLDKAKEKIENFIGACSVISGGKKIVLEALNSEFKDKEDALQYFTAFHGNVDYFLTRNIKDYKLVFSSLAVQTPSQFLKGI